MLFWSGKMTINKSTKDFMWSEAKPVKWALQAECRQSLHDAKFQHFDYRKETPRRKSGFIKPQFRSGSGNTANLQGFRLQSLGENFKDRMAGYRHSKLNT